MNTHRIRLQLTRIILLTISLLISTVCIAHGGGGHHGGNFGHHGGAWGNHGNGWGNHGRYYHGGNYYHGGGYYGGWGYGYPGVIAVPGGMYGGCFRQCYPNGQCTLVCN